MASLGPPAAKGTISVIGAGRIGLRRCRRRPTGRGWPQQGGLISFFMAFSQ